MPPTFEELEGGLLYAMGGRPKGLVVNGEPRARAAQLSDVRLILSPLYLLLRLRWRTEFSLWGLALPRAPGLICLLAAVLRLLFCGRKLGRKRYRDTPLKCSAERKASWHPQGCCWIQVCIRLLTTK